MDIGRIINAVDTGTASLAGALLLPSDTGMASTLTVGQTIKGRVLLQHDQPGRFTVLFSGKPHLVHSDLKLVANETLELKVVATNRDFVHLRRAEPVVAQTANAPPHTRIAWLPHSVAEDVQGQLTEGDLLLLKQLGRRLGAGFENSAAEVILFLKKLGIPPAKPILEQLVLWLQLKDPVALLGKLLEIPPQPIGIAGIAASKTQAGVEHKIDQSLNEKLAVLPGQLVNLIRPETGDRTAEAADGAADGIERSGEQSDFSQRREPSNLAALFAGLLNRQNDTQLAHSYQSLAFLFDNQLIEVDLAFFGTRVTGKRGSEQLGSQGDQGAFTGDSAADSHSRMNRLAFSLKTEALGKVEIQVNAVDRRLNLAFSLESGSVMERFRMRSDSLGALFQHCGWSMDNADYRVENRSTQGSMAKRSVIEQHLLAGSLSRLL